MRLTTGLDAQTISISADDGRFAYAAFSGTSNIWSLPFPPSGEVQSMAKPVTIGSQTVESGWLAADGK